MNQQTTTEVWTSSSETYKIGSKEDLIDILVNIKAQTGITFPWSEGMDTLFNTTISINDFDVVYHDVWKTVVCKLKPHHWFMKGRDCGHYFIPSRLLFPAQEEEIDITINL